MTDLSFVKKVWLFVFLLASSVIIGVIVVAHSSPPDENSPVLISIPIVSGSKGSLSASIFIEKRKFPSKLSPQEHARLDSPVRALETFFYYAMTRQTSRLIGLAFADDGSRERLAASLERNPDRFSRLSLVKEIELKSVAYYGPYTMLLVHLSNTTQEMKWLYAAICQHDVCSMSDYPETLQWDSQFLWAVLEMYVVNNVIPDVHPSKIRSLKRHAVDVWPGYMHSTSYPMTINLGIMRMHEEKAKFEEPPSGASDVLVELLNTMIELRGLDLDDDMNRSLRIADRYFSERYADYRRGHSVTLLHCPEGSNDVQKKQYSAAAFVQRIKSWDAVEVIWVFYEEEVKYVYFYPYISNHKQCLQVLPLGDHGIDFAEKEGVWAVLSSEEAVTELMVAR